MRKFKTFVAILTLAIMLFSITGCDGKYKSSYTARSFSHTCIGQRCGASFKSLDGTFVFRLNYTGNEEGQFIFNATLDEGRVDIYYDAYGIKESLFSVEGGYPTEGYGGYIDRGSEVYVILEAKNARGGRIEVILDDGK